MDGGREGGKKGGKEWREGRREGEGKEVEREGAGSPAASDKPMGSNLDPPFTSPMNLGSLFNKPL